MDVLTVFGIIAKRWYVTLPALLVASLVVFRIADMVSPMAQATGTLVLVPPNEMVIDYSIPSSGQPAPDDNPPLSSVNPFSNVNASHGLVAQILVQSVGGSETRSSIANRGLAPDYELLADGRTPLITVTAQSEQPTRSIETVRRVMAMLEVQLEEMQDEAAAPSYSRITARRLSTPENTTPLSGDRARVLVGAAGLGVAAAIGLALLVDASISVVRGRAIRDSVDSNVRSLHRTNGYAPHDPSDEGDDAKPHHPRYGGYGLPRHGRIDERSLTVRDQAR